MRQQRGEADVRGAVGPKRTSYHNLLTWPRLLSSPILPGMLQKMTQEIPHGGRKEELNRAQRRLSDFKVFDKKK